MQEVADGNNQQFVAAGADGEYASVVASFLLALVNGWEPWLLCMLCTHFAWGLGS